MDLDTLTPEALSESAGLMEELARRVEERKLYSLYSVPFDRLHPPSSDNIGPYPWQVDFHNAGATNPERAIMAGNRTGKTASAAHEVAIHATGWYPEWWRGKRFDAPVRCWTGCESNELSREVIQYALLGPEGAHGTGTIPGEKIARNGVKYRQAGIPNVVDTIRVKHAAGGESQIVLKTYEQKRDKWQGTAQDIVWLDEEPPFDIYTEALTRTLDRRGILMATFTPLLGNSDVVQHFKDGGPGIYMKNVTWADAPHLDEDAKARMLASYPKHERDTRTKGLPMMGSGVVFAISDDEITVQAFDIPPHWARICGVDFGIDHPFAAVWLAWDRDADVIYVYDAHRKSDTLISYQTDAIKQRGKWIPVAWPHDGLKRDPRSGRPIWKLYRDKGVRMLKESARYDKGVGGGQPIEPGLMDISERMEEGRFKVFSHLDDWLEEKRMYHREDGKVVSVRDDLMDATRYAVMMKRRAITPERPTRRERKYQGPIIGGRRVA